MTSDVSPAQVRPPAVAGSFYPADRGTLADLVDSLLTAAGATSAPVEDGGLPPRALVVPHAGYVYSGPVAAAAYHRLPRAGIGTVALLGPAHHVRVEGIAGPTTSGFRTPLGTVPVDTATCARLEREGLASLTDRPHAREHSLEVQLPFLQAVLGTGWSLVPLAVGAASDDQVADCVEALTGTAPDTFVLISTDLSHYLDQDSARELDRRTAAAVVALRPDLIGHRDACGAVPLRGLLTWARRHDLDMELLDLRTSADTAGDPSRVVGYGAFALR